MVTVDSPIGDNTTNPPAGLTDKNSNQWYRIRSTGHARLSGLARVSNDILSDPNARRSNALRKFSLRRIGLTGEDLTTGPTPGPQAIRTIEQIVKPKTGYSAALIARTSLSVTGNQTIDSYDSSNSFKSTNGLYDPAKRQGNGNVAVAVPSPGPVPSGALTIGSGEKVYGNAGTDAQIVGGTNFTDPNNTIQAPGTINNGFSIDLPAVPVPTWGTAGNPPINGSVTNVTTATTMTVNSDPTQNYYKIANITAPLTIASLPAGTTATVNIWLTGTATVKNGITTYSGGMKPGGAITIPKGVTLKIYVDNGVSFHPGQNGQNVGAIDNQNMDASTFLLYGVGIYPGGNAGAGIDLHVGGGSTIANFYGTVYAPYRYVLMKYDGNTNYDNLHGFYGSFVGNIMTVQGSFHYDEASAAGIVNDYVRASYVEDPR